MNQFIKLKIRDRKHLIKENIKKPIIQLGK
jgi:hypothetical protein